MQECWYLRLKDFHKRDEKGKGWTEIKHEWYTQYSEWFIEGSSAFFARFGGLILL